MFQAVGPDRPTPPFAVDIAVPEFITQLLDFLAANPQWAYIAFFAILVLSGAGAPVAEEIIVVAAGVMVHRGLMDPIGAWCLCYAGILIADTLLVAVGRRFGKALLHKRWTKRLIHPRRLLHAHHHVHEHGAWVIAASRFIPGSRWPTLLIAGVTHLPFWRFLLADALAAIASVTIQLAAGYYLAALTAAQFEHGERWVTILMVALGLVLLLAYVLYRYFFKTGKVPRPRIGRFTHLRKRHRKGIGDRNAQAGRQQSAVGQPRVSRDAESS